MVTAVQSEPAAADTAAAPAADRSGRHLWVAALSLGVGLLLGGAMGILWPRLTMPGPDSTEAGFARDMSTHHAQAVEMGMIAYAKASDGDVRAMGGDIALNQQGQIGIMQSWLRAWSLDPTGSQRPMEWMPGGPGLVRNGLMPGMATPVQMQKLRDATGKTVDVEFLRLMQQHHLGGIHMAQAILELTEDAEVKEFAQIMVNGQQRELTDIRSLMDRLSTTS
jgi:uncharacterized protein (DUF305 family)